MKILKKDKISFVLIISGVVTLLMILTFVLITLSSYKTYKKDVNYALENVLQIIKEKYPNIDDGEIIKAFNNPNLFGETEILNKYGIDDEHGALAKMNNDMHKHIIINVIIILSFVCLLILLFVIYLLYRDRKIKEIHKYIEAINNKNYSLAIKDNDESELSNLKNELYKITVMLKEEAERADKERLMLSDAVSDISHQLKTPLTSMSIMLDNIQNDESMTDEVRKDFLREISKQIEWINFLVISLLKLARFDAGVIEFKKERIKTKKLIEKVKDNLAITSELKDVEIVITNQENSSFLGDFNWQTEALTNIVKNCMEHTDSGKKVYISYEDNNFYTKIIVKDEGIGMSEKDLKNIFKRFYKGKNSSDTSIGIGLSLAKTIIEKGNGYITCDSKENEGTIFEIKYMKI